MPGDTVRCRGPWSMRSSDRLRRQCTTATASGSLTARMGRALMVPLADRLRAGAAFTIKGNADSMLYHRPDSRSYAVTVAEVWFDTPERAEAAGFRLANTHPNTEN